MVLVKEIGGWWRGGGGCETIGLVRWWGVAHFLVTKMGVHSNVLLN